MDWKKDIHKVSKYTDPILILKESHNLLSPDWYQMFKFLKLLFLLFF